MACRAVQPPVQPPVLLDPECFLSPGRTPQACGSIAAALATLRLTCPHAFKEICRGSICPNFSPYYGIVACHGSCLSTQQLMDKGAIPIRLPVGDTPSPTEDHRLQACKPAHLLREPSPLAAAGWGWRLGGWGRALCVLGLYFPPAQGLFPPSRVPAGPWGIFPGERPLPGLAHSQLSAESLALFS